MTDNELKVIPEYSPEGFLGYQVLFDSYDDLIVYIEDSKGVHIYETIINRLFGNSLTINHINAVGGKKNLEEIYRESLKNKLDKNKKACFFIADLDFDQLLNKKTIIDDNFVYLKRYSIENYLVDEKVGVAFINGRNNEGAFNCKNRLNFSSWQDNLTQQMRRLILIFATIQSLDLGIENAGLSAARFTKERMLYELDQEKIVDYLMKTVYEDYKKNNKFGFAKNYLKLQKRLDTLYKNNSWRLIPGKQLLQLFIYYLMSFVGNRGGPVREDFENMAAHCCDLAELSFLRSSIEKYLNIFLNSKTG